MKTSSISEFIYSSLKPFRGWLLALTLLNSLWAIDLSLRPYVLKIILDRVSSTSPQNALSQLSTPVALYVLMSVAMMIIFRFYDYVWININAPLKRYLGQRLMERMMCHSHSFFLNQFAGGVSNRIKDVMNGVVDFMKIAFDNFFSHFVSLSIAIFASSTVSYRFALALCVWALCFVACSLFFSKRACLLSKKASEAKSMSMGHMLDVLGNMMTVRLFAGSAFESKKWKETQDSYVEAEQKRDKYFMLMSVVQGLSFVLYQSVCLIWLIYGFHEGKITPGDFAFIISLNIALVDSLWSLARDMGKFAESIGGIKQGLNLILSPIEIQDSPRAKLLCVTRGEIVFDKVQFNYKSAESLFENKSIVIPSGQKVGLVGYSGGGKSTFVNLILRLYDVTAGSIQIDGQDIREVTQDSLRSSIGLIPQDPILFHRSLFENIQYGRLDATSEEVFSAARRAHADEFIRRLSLGYNSLVGERGIKLSGGQRQRVAIARAILKNAPILILDEATSQLDSVTELQIQQSLWELMQGKTALVIAHRLSTLLDMDRILVFNQGRIVEDGSHRDLIAKNGLYTTLWRAQVGGFLSEDKLS